MASDQTAALAIVINGHSKAFQQLPKSSTTQPLPWKTKLFYPFGHFFNDMVVSIYFSYTLVFFRPRLSGALPGYLLLIGQAADACSSPLIGHLSDHFADTWPFSRYGRRKIWHLLGILISCIAVPLLYNRCLLGDDQPEAVQFAYYACLVVIFQGAWAATQVNHVSLINDLTPLQNERISLYSGRQAGTIVANIVMYAISYFFLESISSKDSSTLNKDDLVAFTNLSYSVCIFGVFLTLFFYIFVQEPANEAKQSKPKIELAILELNGKETQNFKSIESLSPSPQPPPPVKKPRKLNLCALFASRTFWNIALLYTSARIFVNMSQVHMPLYLQYYLHLPKEALAIIPLVTNVASLLFSFLVNEISKRNGSRASLILGVIIGLLSSAWILLGDYFQSFHLLQIYFVAAFIGMAGTTMLISGLSLHSDLVGSDNTGSNASVFATISFIDKFLNGAVIAFLEQLKPTESQINQQPTTYYKYIMSCVTGVPSLLIIPFFIAILSTKFGRPVKTTEVSAIPVLRSATPETKTFSRLCKHCLKFSSTPSLCQTTARTIRNTLTHLCTPCEACGMKMTL